MSVRELAKEIVHNSQLKTQCENIRQLPAELGFDLSEALRLSTFDRESLHPQKLAILDLYAKYEKIRRTIKDSLPCITPSLCSDTRGQGKSLGQHTGLLQVDVDLKDNPDKSYEELRSIIESHPSLCLCGKSPSGGVKGFLVMPLPEGGVTKESNHVANAAAIAWFHDKGVKLDNMRDVKKLCYLFHDPHPYFKEPHLVEAMDLSAVESVELLHSKQYQGFQCGIEAQGYRSIDAQGSSSIGAQDHRGTGLQASRVIDLTPKGRGGRRGAQFAKEKRATEALHILERNKPLHYLYEKQVMHNFPAEQGTRHTTLNNLVYRLYRAVGEDQIKPLAMAFYDINQGEFIDSREQHEIEFNTCLESVKADWFESLPPDARECVETFSSDMPLINAFRICHDLQAFKPVTEKGREKWKDLLDRCFVMGEAQLGKRLGIASEPAARLLKKLKRLEVISVEKKGTQYKKSTAQIEGEKNVRKPRAMATSYRWLLDQTS